MRLGLAAAVSGLTLLTVTPALPWGSVQSPDFDTHSCLDEAAYAFLRHDPSYKSSAFPTLAAIEAHEGVDVEAKGNGPDAKDATKYSEHYYNPLNPLHHRGLAAQSTGKYFYGAAFGPEVKDKEKGAAWSAHFIADLSVPFHVHGMYGVELQQAYLAQIKATGAAEPAEPPRWTGGWGQSLRSTLAPHIDFALPLPPEVTGDPQSLSYPLISSLPYSNNGETFGLSAHGNDYRLEAERYLAVMKTDPYYDWFDPWYWNGYKVAPEVTSSHLVWEGKVAPSCPPQVTQYSSLWPGNPTPVLDQSASDLKATVIAFAAANARNTQAQGAGFLDHPDSALTQAAESIATIWRASISGLRVNETHDFDPATLNDARVVPIANVHPVLHNVADETVTQVKVRLTVNSGSCSLVDPKLAILSVPELKNGLTYPNGWKVAVPDQNNCQLKLVLIGKFDKTPDRQYADRSFNIQLPNSTVPQSPIPCNCKPKDMGCLILCKLPDPHTVIQDMTGSRPK